MRSSAGVWNVDMATLSWALDRIEEWRNEAGDFRVPDRERLQAILRSLHRRRVHAGFVLYLVLGCEWLFRMRLDSGERHIVALDDTTMPIRVADPVAWTPAEPRPRPGGRMISTRPGPALLGEYRQVDRGEFRRARGTLRGGAAEQLLANFERWLYEYLPGRCAGLDWQRQWADGIRSIIDLMGPRHTFPVAPEIVAGLFDTYRAPGRQRNQKPAADST
jgi:hypothetical protein